MGFRVSYLKYGARGVLIGCAKAAQHKRRERIPERKEARCDVARTKGGSRRDRRRVVTLRAQKDDPGETDGEGGGRA